MATDQQSMTELRAGLMALAKRSLALIPSCTDEEAVRRNIVLPFLALLGYGTSDAREVYPDHVATTGGRAVKAGVAILRDGVPVIGIEVRKVGTETTGDKSRLADYFNALASVKLGIVSNGIVTSFYVDSIAAGTIDEEPFLTIDLETISSSGFIDEEPLGALLAVTRSRFNPASLAETAHVGLVKRRLRKVFLDEARAPSEEFCRFALERIGISGAHREAVERYYAPLVHAAFEEGLVLPVVRQLKADRDQQSRNFAANLAQIAQRLVTSERETAIFAYVRRRLAFLISGETEFSAIEAVGCEDYIGKLSVYYESVGKGRLFDYIEGADGYDKFIFPEPYGEIVTNNIYEIDDALRTTFVMRVREIGAAGLTQRLARIA